MDSEHREDEAEDEAEEDQVSEQKELLARAALTAYLRGLADRAACVGRVGPRTPAYERGYDDMTRFLVTNDGGRSDETRSVGEMLDAFITEECE